MFAVATITIFEYVEICYSSIDILPEKTNCGQGTIKCEHQLLYNWHPFQRAFEGGTFLTLEDLLEQPYYTSKE